MKTVEFSLCSPSMYRVRSLCPDGLGHVGHVWRVARYWIAQTRGGTRLREHYPTRRDAVRALLCQADLENGRPPLPGTRDHRIC